MLTSYRVKDMVLLSLLASLATVVAIAESWLPMPLPGVRLGAANVFILLALLLYGVRACVSVASVRLFAILLLTGNVFAFFASAGGLICSLPVMTALYKKFGEQLSVEAISVAAAAAFNVGQVAAVIAMTSEPAIIVYLPPIAAIGMATGFAVGWLAGRIRALVKRFYCRSDNNILERNR